MGLDLLKINERNFIVQTKTGDFDRTASNLCKNQLETFLSHLDLCTGKIWGKFGQISFWSEHKVPTPPRSILEFVQLFSNWTISIAAEKVHRRVCFATFFYTCSSFSFSLALRQIEVISMWHSQAELKQTSDDICEREDDRRVEWEIGKKKEETRDDSKCEIRQIDVTYRRLALYVGALSFSLALYFSFSKKICWCTLTHIALNSNNNQLKQTRLY